MEQRINQDLKAAMLAGDKTKVEVLKGIKNALIYETVTQKIKGTGLNEEQAQRVLSRESKKRAEAADIYKKAGESKRAELELAEKIIIDAYLPKQLSETEILDAIKKQISQQNISSMADMGRIIGSVKERLGATADGATIARLTKKELEQK